MRLVTLCFLVDKDNICLAMKKRGFGEGKWNGVGGKVGEGENLEEAAIRELEEEIGVRATVDSLEKVGDLQFRFNEHSDWNQHMHIYFIYNWEGEPVETEEMRPEWYKKHAIPYEKMWVDDPFWLPKVIDGKRITGKFYFKGDGGEIDRFELEEF